MANVDLGVRVMRQSEGNWLTRYFLKGFGDLLCLLPSLPFCRNILGYSVKLDS